MECNLSHVSSEQRPCGFIITWPYTVTCECVHVYLWGLGCFTLHSLEPQKKIHKDGVMLPLTSPPQTLLSWVSRTQQLKHCGLGSDYTYKGVLIPGKPHKHVHTHTHTLPCSSSERLYMRRATLQQWEVFSELSVCHEKESQTRNQVHTPPQNRTVLLSWWDETTWSDSWYSCYIETNSYSNNTFNMVIFTLSRELR